MRWKECILLAKRKVGTDKLGNDQYEFRVVGNTVCRFSPWTNDQIAIEGREVTKNEQRYVIPIDYCHFPVCQKVRIDSREYDITQVIDLSPRYTAIQVKLYGG